LTTWANGDNLINAVASVHQNTIVVINSVGPLNVEPWIDNPNVTAVSGPRLPIFLPFESITLSMDLLTI